MKKKRQKAPEAPVPRITHPKVAKQVVAMSARVKSLRDGQVPNDVLDRVLDSYTQAMLEILEEHSVLTPEMVGEEACRASFYLLCQKDGQDYDKRRKLLIGYVVMVRRQYSEDHFFQILLREFAAHIPVSAENCVSGYVI